MCIRDRTGTAQAIGRIGAVIGPLFVGILIDHQIKIAVIFGIFMAALLIGAVAVLMLPAVDSKEVK